MKAKCTVVAVLILTAVIAAFLTAGVMAQYEPARPKDTQDVHPTHKTVEDFEDTVGFRQVEFISKDHRLLFYKKDYKSRVFLGSFAYDKYTRFYLKEPLGKACVLYCKVHHFAYIIAPCE